MSFITFQVMIVLDVPTPAYIHELTTSFATSPFFARLHSKSESDRNDFGVHLVVHICGEGVLEDARYKAFMNGFADDTHVISSIFMMRTSSQIHSIASDCLTRTRT